MSSNAPVPVNFDAFAVGSSSSNVFITEFALRDPTPNDVNFPIKKRWINTVAANEWILTGFTTIAEQTTANWLEINIGGISSEKFLPDSGTSPVVPDAFSQVGVHGVNTVTVIGGTNEFTVTPTSAGYPITPYVVGPVGQAGYQTIQAGLNAANAAGGGMVWVQPGTYTENLTLYDKTQVIGAVGFSDYGNTVEINGLHTPPTSGAFTFRNVYLTSATHVLSSASAGTATLIVADCAVGVINGYLFNIPNWTGNILLWDVNSSFGTNDGCVNNTAGAFLLFFQSGLGTGNTHAMIVSGIAVIGGCQAACPFHAVTGADLLVDGSQFVNPVTLSNNTIGYFDTCNFQTGSAAAITMSSSGAIQLSNSSISSSNNPAIAGAGAGVLTISDVDFLGNFSISGSLTLAQGQTRGGNFISQLVVGPSPDAYYQTIQSAITAATAPALVVVKAGTYNETLTLKDGVNIISLGSDSLTKQLVTLNGDINCSSACTCVVNGLIVNTTTNGFNFTSANAQAVTIENCNISSSTGACITNSNSNASTGISFNNCAITRVGATPMALSQAAGISFSSCSVSSDTGITFTGGNGSTVSFNSSNIALGGTQSVAGAVITLNPSGGVSELFFINSSVGASISLPAAGNLTFSGGFIANGTSPFVLNGSGNFVINATYQTNATYTITGSGTYTGSINLISAIAGGGINYFLDPALTLSRHGNCGTSHSITKGSINSLYDFMVTDGQAQMSGGEIPPVTCLIATVNVNKNGGVGWHSMNMEYNGTNWVSQGNTTNNGGCALVGDALGNLYLQVNPNTGGTTQASAGNVVIQCSNTLNVGINGNSFGSGTQVIFIANATAAPSGSPTGGGILYVDSGALKYKGSSGTVTPIAPA